MEILGRTEKKKEKKQKKKTLKGKSQKKNGETRAREKHIRLAGSAVVVQAKSKSLRQSIIPYVRSRLLTTMISPRSSFSGRATVSRAHGGSFSLRFHDVRTLTYPQLKKLLLPLQEHSSTRQNDYLLSRRVGSSSKQFKTKTLFGFRN